MQKVTESERIWEEKKEDWMTRELKRQTMTIEIAFNFSTINSAGMHETGRKLRKQEAQSC